MRGINFNLKKVLLISCFIICVFITLSGIYAVDVDMENDTVTLTDDVMSDDISQAQLSPNDDEDMLGAANIYFDSSAKSDGDGSQLRPFKYFTADRIIYGSNVYFANGVYELSGSANIYSSSTHKTTFTGSDNTVITSGNSNRFDFTITPDSYLILKDLVFEGIHINNQGNLKANNVDFRNTVGFDSEFHPSLTYAHDVYDSSYGGVITCDTPNDRIVTLTLDDCSFDNNNANSGGAIAAYRAIVQINNCNFYNSTATRFGGAIYATNSNLNITDSFFIKNKAKYGGAIYSKNNQLLIHYSQFWVSQSTSFGGVIASDESYMVVIGSTFNNCTSLNDAGGAIYSVNGELYIDSSNFTKGRAYYGGGAICNLKTDFIVANTEFNDNYAEGFGGAIYNMYGDITIEKNNFMLSSSGVSGGVLSNRLSTSLKLIDNVFLQSSSNAGQILAIDGDKDTMTISGNQYRELYYLVSVYRSYLYGQEYTITSNYLMFSVSNTDDFIHGKYDDTLDSDSSDYGDFHIAVENYPYNPVYSNFTRQHKLIFNLTKFNNNFQDVDLELYIIDLAGNVVYLGAMPIFKNGNYVNEEICDFNFDELAMYYGNNTSYDSVNHANVVPLFNYTAPAQSALPSSYDSRDYGYVTPVKDQLDGGNCWVFSGLATLEASIKKATGLEYDFSEENAKNIMSEFSLWGLGTEVNEGGNMRMFMAYLASGFGPILDESDEYDDYSSLSPIFPAVLQIQDIITLPNRQNFNDNALIKKTIMDCGAVSVSLKWDDGGHAISLIGWDDDYYSYDVFGNYAKGAWIFKNSWGNDWGDNGFGYLTYDYEIYNVYSFIFNQSKGFTHVYQYDFAGVTDYLKFNYNNLYYKNIFTSTESELLSAVSTYFYDETTYMISVYLNNTLVLTQNGKSVAGYHTIILSREISLNPGDKFTVEIKVSNNGVNTIPLSQSENLNQATFNEGCSFISFDGSTWNDLYNYVYVSGGIVHACQVACIKAFTKPLHMENITIGVNKFTTANINQQVSIRVDVPEYCYFNGYYYNVKGFVTYKINGQYYYAQIQDGQACLNITFDKEGTYNVIAQYVSNYIESNIVSFSFNVVKSTDSIISIFAPEITKYYGDSQKYTVTLMNNANPIVGKYVKLEVNGYNYLLPTDSNGQVSYDFKLNPGNYIVTCYYDDMSYSSKYLVKSTVNVGDTVGEYSNTNISATFLNSNGYLIDNVAITFKINNQEFKAKTDSNGHVNVNIALNAGNYTASVKNPLSGEEKHFNLVILKADSNFTITTLQEGKLITITATSSQQSATGYVYIILDDDVNKVNLENGQANLEIGNLNPDNYNVSVVYSGDDNYKVSNSHKVFSVEDTDIDLNAKPVSKYYGGLEQFCVNVTNNNVAVGGVTVKVTIGGKTFKNITNSNGTAYFDINLAVGEYDVVCEYGGISISSNVIVKSTIDVGNFNVDYQNSNVNAVFRDSDGNLVRNENVIFKVNNHEFGSTTNNQGVATGNINLNAGTYNLISINPITKEQKQTRLVISKITPKLSLTMDELDDKYLLTVNLSSITSNGNMLCTFDGTDYTSDVKNGIATFVIKVAKTSNYTILVRYTGDANLNTVSSFSDYNLKNKADIITANGFTTNYGQNKDLKIRLTNCNGIVLSNTKVYYSINGDSKQLSLITDSNGIAKLKCNFNPGTYNIVLKSDNNALCSLKITIKKLTPTLKASKKTFKMKTKTKKYSVTLKLNGRVFKNKKLTLKVKGKTYKATTNSKGKATFKITKLKKKGNHKAVITYSGDQYYNKVSKTVKIKVKK